MNTIIETLLTRRSVRFYQSKPIDRPILDELILTANSTPSGAGTQLWRFVVVLEPHFRKKLAQLALPRYQKRIEKAQEFLKKCAMRSMHSQRIRSIIQHRMLSSSSAKA
jgi:nitroreductase